MCHGDLGYWNMVLREDGGIGVIDFGDIGHYDRSKDFIGFEDAEALDEALKVYGDSELLRQKVAIRQKVLANSYFGNEVIKVDTEAGERVGSAEVASADNLAWAPTRELPAASHQASIPDMLACQELEALTRAGARALELDDRVGSLASGKDADFVVLSGAPFSTYTHVEQTWVEGELVYDRARPEHRKWATGGEDTYPSRTVSSCSTAIRSNIRATCVALSLKVK